MNGKRNNIGFVIRGIIAPLLILAMGAGVILLCYSNFLDRTAQKRANSLLAESAQEQSMAMEERVNSSFQQLGIISASLDSDGDGDIYTDRDLPELMQRLRAQSQFDNIAVSGPEGKLLYQNGTVADCSDRDYFKKAIEGTANIEYITRGRLSGDTVFVFAAPVYREMNIIGVIVATRSLSDISSGLNVKARDYGQARFLCYGSGEVIAVPTKGNTLLRVGENVSDYFENPINVENIPADEVFSYTHDGEKYYGIYTDSGFDDIYIFAVVSAGSASAMSGLYSKWSIAVILLIFAIALVVLVAVIVQLRRRISIATKEEAEQSKKLEEYHKFQNKRSLDRTNVIGSIRFNLTQNRCSVGEGRTLVVHNLAPDATVDELCLMISEKIHPEDKEKFDNTISRAALGNFFENGKSRVQNDFQIYVDEKRYIWVRMIVDLVRNPMTGDLEALMYALRINDEKRLEQIGTKLINESYNAMALIDVRSGCVFGIKRIGSSRLELIDHGEKSINYNEVARQTLLKYCGDIGAEFADMMIFDRVLEGLEEKAKYNITTHVSGDVEKYYRVEYSYLDSRRESVIVSCVEITDILASKMDIPTGLYNSVGFHEQVRKWLRENPGRKYRMIRYNLDGFSDINGTFGYETGNKLLRDIGRYMLRNNSKDSFSAHLSSDHFVRFCAEDCPSPEKYFELFEKDFENYDLPYPISIHAGVYDLCEPDDDSFTMSYKAHLALRSVKGDLTEHVAYYKDGLLQATREQQELIYEVDRAIAERQFELWFQPQVRYPGGAIIGAEALVRWRHPTKGVLQPAGFIPLLEKSKQITRVDQFVWEEACRYVRHFDELGVSVPISVNVSRNDLRGGIAYNTLTSLVKKYGIEPSKICVEITESAYFSETEKLISEVERFRRAGFVVEMDDFGSGYSSLNMLNNLNIDVLKLDKDLIAQLGEGEKCDSIMQAVVQMARSLGIMLIAEGVETKRQADYLFEEGCTNMQGYYFSKPIDAKSYEELIRKGTIGGRE